jgi:apolipoprotein D and lipocalin family protein
MVSFFWPFSGNYWIIDLDPENRWAVVGEPGRDYLWILSRERRLDEAQYQRILARAKQQGYEVGRLMKTAQPPS